MPPFTGSDKILDMFCTCLAGRPDETLALDQWRIVRRVLEVLYTDGPFAERLLQHAKSFGDGTADDTLRRIRKAVHKPLERLGIVLKAPSGPATTLTRHSRHHPSISSLATSIASRPSPPRPSSESDHKLPSSPESTRTSILVAIPSVPAPQPPAGPDVTPAVPVDTSHDASSLFTATHAPVRSTGGGAEHERDESTDDERPGRPLKRPRRDMDATSDGSHETVKAREDGEIAPTTPSKAIAEDPPPDVVSVSKSHVTEWAKNVQAADDVSIVSGVSKVRRLLEGAPFHTDPHAEPSDRVTGNSSRFTTSTSQKYRDRIAERQSPLVTLVSSVASILPFLSAHQDVPEVANFIHVIHTCVEHQPSESRRVIRNNRQIAPDLGTATGLDLMYQILADAVIEVDRRVSGASSDVARPL